MYTEKAKQFPSLHLEQLRILEDLPSMLTTMTIMSHKFNPLLKARSVLTLMYVTLKGKIATLRIER